jgi:hypothetical protein
VTKPHTGQSRGFGGGTLPNLSAASRRQASGLDAAIARGQHAAMAPGEVSDLTDDGTSPTSPSILNHADAIRFLERARSRR